MQISKVHSSKNPANFWLTVRKTLIRQREAPIIKQISRAQNLPLSFAQERLWFINQLEPNSIGYQFSQGYYLVSPLDISALEKSLTEIQRRHETLRTTFAIKKGTPVQIIASSIPYKLPIIDLLNLSEAELNSEIKRLFSEESQKPFNLAQEPSWRVKLLRIKAEKYVMLLSMHHIVYDGWCLSLFFRELVKLYQAFNYNKSSPLPELPIQYADFAYWQREWLKDNVLKSQLTYWKTKLGGSLPILQLPTDRPRPAIQTYRGASQYLAFPQDLTNSIKSLTQQECTTLFVTLLTAFKVLLYRYTGQKDIIVGTPVANRNRAEIQEIIGFFANTLALRTDLSGNPTFRQLLNRVRQGQQEALAHQDLPFEKLIAEIQPERDLSRNPLFQVMLVFTNTPTSLAASELSDLIVRTIGIPKKTAKFDLTFFLTDTPQGLRGILEYPTDLFDASTITRLLEHFQILLEGIVANPDRPISELPLLGRMERQQLLIDWNNTKTEYAQDLSIQQLFETQVAKTPKAIAVRFQDQQLTYQQLNNRANQLARYLQKLGVKPERLVGIFVERSLDGIVGILGIIKAGAAYVPLDPSYPQERLSFILKDAQISILVTQKNLIAKLPAHSCHLVCLDEDWTEIERELPENVSTGILSDNLAYIIYTSGSTGKPKGVALEHRTLTNLISWQLENTTISQTDKTLQFAPISFDVSLQEIWATLCSGGTLVLITTEWRRDTNVLLELLEQEKIDRIFLPFVALQQLAEVAQSREFVPTNLREIITAGEQLQITPAIKSLFEQLPQCTLYNHYGPSETHVATCFKLPSLTKDWSNLPSIGRPIANTKIYILDSDLQSVPIGVPGEIYIQGMGVARGYLNLTQLTAGKFILSPFNSKEKLYKTGDLARYLPDGKIEYIGRLDNQVKIRGYRVELGEIEANLAQHPGIKETAVIVNLISITENVPDEKRLVAYVVLEADRQTSKTELREFLKQRLPEYAVPATFIILDKLPLIPSGKVDRRLLETVPLTSEGQIELNAIPLSDWHLSKQEQQLFYPQNLTQELLARIWIEALGIEDFNRGKTEINILDNFFEIGGHSLAATRIINRIEEVFQLRLPLRYLFENPTIVQLATKIDSELQTQSDRAVKTWSPLVAIQKGGNKIPCFIVPGGAGGENELMIYAKLIYLLGQSQPVYGLQIYGFEESGWQGEHGFHPNVESLAAAYLQEIRQVQPHSPYIIVGECAGGVIAFEIAQQLFQLGEEVSLILMDTLCPIRKNTKPISLVSQKYFEAINVSIRNKSNAQLIREAHENYKAIIRNYQPQDYQGKMSLIVSRDDPNQELVKNWQSLAKECEIYEVSGNHDSYLGEFVSTTARQLKACLDSALPNSNYLEINQTEVWDDLVSQQQRETDSSNLVKLETATQSNYAELLGKNHFWHFLNPQERIDAVYQKAFDLQPNNPSVYCALAATQRRRKQFTQAIAAYQKAIALDPYHFEAYRGLGNTLCEQEKLDEALIVFEQALNLDPFHPGVYTDLGEYQIKKNDREEALKYCQKSLELLKLNPRISWGNYNKLARVFRELQKYPEAISIYQKALEIYPQQLNIYVLLGSTQKEQGNLAAAISSYQQAIKLNTQQPFRVYRDLAEALIEAGEIEQAIVIYQQAVNLYPNRANGYRLLGNALRQAGQIEAAIVNYQQAIELSPQQSFHTYKHLGAIFTQQEKLEQAIESYQKAIALNSNQSGAIYQKLAEIFGQQQKFRAAINNLQEALKLQPKNSEIRRQLNLYQAELKWIQAKKFRQAGNLERAIKLYKSGLDIDPHNEPAWRQLAQILLKQGNWSQAIDCYRKALKLRPDYPHLYRLLGSAFHEQGNLSAAVKQYQKAIELEPKHVESHLICGNILQQSHQLDAAIDCYQQAIELNPNKPRNYRLLGHCWRKQGELEKAIAAYQQAIELNPAQSVEVYRNLGNSLKQLELLDKAVESYQKAIALYPDDPHLYHGLGNVWITKGNLSAAEQAYHQALEINPELTQVESKISALIFNQAVPLWSQGNIEAAREKFQTINLAGKQEEIQLLWPSIDSIEWPGRSFNLADIFETMKPREMSWPKITVVTPSFNHQEYIEDTIRSVIYQEYPNLEYVIVDGESTDGTREILDRYQEQVSEIIIEPDQGQSDAINKGFSRTTGELITWINSDDMLAPGALHMAALTYLNHDCDVVAGIAITHEDSQNPEEFRSIRVKKPRVRQHDFTVETLADCCHYWFKGHFFIQPEAIFTRQAWNQAGGKLDEELEYTMDCDFWFRMAQICARLEVISWPIAFYRNHPGQKTANRIVSVREHLKLRNKYHLIAPRPERKLEILDKISSFLTSLQRRVLVISKQADCCFSEHTESQLHNFFAKRNYHISFCRNLKHIEVTAFDVVIVLVHLKKEVELIKKLREQGFSGTIIAWFWQNNRGFFPNIEVADEVDISIPGHKFIGEVLRNYSSIVTPAISVCSAEWTVFQARKFFSSCGYQNRSDQLLVGFWNYEVVEKQQHMLIPYQVVQLVEQLKESFLNCQICFEDKAQQNADLGLSSQHRFSHWTKYKVSLLLTLERELPFRLFDTLLWGQIPIISSDIFDLDQVISPQEQAQLPIIRLERYDLDCVRDAYQQALTLFERDGAEGIKRRHKFVRNNHMLIHRLKTIFNLLENSIY
ncbi:non-ribosomal peptide synthetase [Pleurocapsa sp. PCC 7319]|uniref:non-ribosomal peptide synthetase n=1 Tax=Pleurocapsa sp. PCC 7319 TaxID=118161 RepID=UPI00034DD1B8|nr:non-ribosomal peptide synthetase [Pleurocapsa sp. PCC 7319]